MLWVKIKNYLKLKWSGFENSKYEVEEFTRNKTYREKGKDTQ